MRAMRGLISFSGMAFCGGRAARPRTFLARNERRHLHRKLAQLVEHAVRTVTADVGRRNAEHHMFLVAILAFAARAQIVILTSHALVPMAAYLGVTYIAQDVFMQGKQLLVRFCNT
uniref:Putative secreted peptide n=1 Tax=Anopheles braziliensis TaxID=58242 RepID=A0A2M3ZXN0_9DIPT